MICTGLGFEEKLGALHHERTLRYRDRPSPKSGRLFCPLQLDGQFPPCLGHQTVRTTGTLHQNDGWPCPQLRKGMNRDLKLLSYFSNIEFLTTRTCSVAPGLPTGAKSLLDQQTDLSTCGIRRPEGSYTNFLATTAA